MFHFEYSWVFWATNVLCIMICAFMTFKLFDHTIIFSTAAMGSYLFIRGVSCYAGHYYNEFTMANLLKSGAITDIDPWYWCYVVGFVILLGLGLVY